RPEIAVLVQSADVVADGEQERAILEQVLGVLREADELVAAVLRALHVVPLGDGPARSGLLAEDGALTARRLEPEALALELERLAHADRDLCGQQRVAARDEPEPAVFRGDEDL